MPMNSDTIGMLRPKQMQRESGRSNDFPTLSEMQVAQLSGISEHSVVALVEYGVLTPIDAEFKPWRFEAECVMTLQHAEQMRRDLLLDSHGFALAVMFLTQKATTDAELRTVRSELRECQEREE
jgi:hypothetical protein